MGFLVKCIIKVGPVCVRRIIAPNSLRLTAQSDPHFIPWHICSFQHKLSFSVKHSSMLQFLREDFIHMFLVQYKQLCFIVTPRALGILSLSHLHDMSSRKRRTININAGRFCLTCSQALRSYSTYKAANNLSSLLVHCNWQDKIKIRTKFISN